MDASTIIDRMGGAKAVMEITGLTRSRISQWRTKGEIPRPWLLLFQAKRPDIFGQPRRRSRPKRGHAQ